MLICRAPTRRAHMTTTHAYSLNYRDNVAVQEVVQSRRRTTIMPGKVRFGRSVRSDRGPSTAESGHAVLNRLTGFSSLRPVTSASAGHPACTGRPWPAATPEPATRLGLFSECRWAEGAEGYLLVRV